MLKKSLLFLALASLAVGLFIYLKEPSLSRSLKSDEIPDVTVIGPIEMADGIGRQTAELASVLLEDFKVNIITNYVVRTDVPSKIKKLLRRDARDFEDGTRKLGKVVIFEESIWAPGADTSRFLETATWGDDQIRIAYSMLESTGIPLEWVMLLNLYFDAVAVPDSFLVESYRKSGVLIPIFELPLGLGLEGFLKQPLKQSQNPKMVFANLSSCLDRKNQVLLVQAFAKAFGNNEDVVLQINCRTGDEETQKALVEEIMKANCSNIIYTELTLRKDAYLKNFKNVDCYVSLSKGEGFSIQPREAMALGIPVIVTDNTGQSTICKTGLVKVVESSIAEPARYFGRPYKAGYRFNCTVDDAAAAMLDVYNNYDKYLQNGAEARKWAAFYSYSNGYLKKLYKTLVSPKEVVLGKENKLEPDRLTVNSQELYEKYLRLTKNQKR